MLSEICQSGDYFLEEKIDGYWYEFEKTENYKIYPTKIKEIIKDPNKMYHIVDNLIKNETL